MAAAAPMDTREDSELDLTAIEEREDPHTKGHGPFGKARTVDDDRIREAATVKGSKQQKRAQHREDELDERKRPNVATGGGFDF